MTEVVHAPQTRVRRLALCVTEDWFVLSHFTPLIRALKVVADEVIVITRDSGRAHEIAAMGVRIVPFDFERQSTHPVRVPMTAIRLRQVLARERPDIVHLVALKPIVLAALALATLRTPRVGIHVTGLGLIAAAQSKRKSAMLTTARAVIRRMMAHPTAHLFVENEDDLGLLLDAETAQSPRITVLGGAGVDPAHFTAMPLPPGPPSLGYVGRLIASKGVEVLIEAMRLLRKRGYATRLDLHGMIDTDNPEAISEATIRAWEREGLAVWHGHTSDVRAVWRAAAIAVVPSRGGEGLPRSLLEAAACGRPVVVTNVPGCRRFARDGVEGFVVPPGDAQALAEALEKLILSRQLCADMGARAAARVLDGYTESAVERDVIRAYLGEPRRTANLLRM